MSWSSVPEGPNVYRTTITQNLKAPEEREWPLVVAHCAPPELKAYTVALQVESTIYHLAVHALQIMLSEAG